MPAARSASVVDGLGGTVFVASGWGGPTGGTVFVAAAVAGGTVAGGTVAGGTVPGVTIAGGTVAGGTVLVASAAGGTIAADAEVGGTVLAAAEPEVAAGDGAVRGAAAGFHSDGVGPAGRSGSWGSASPKADGGHAGMVCSVGGSGGQISL